MPFFELNVDQKLDDSISSLESMASDDESEDEDEVQVPRRARRRASIEPTRAPCTPVQQTTAVRRPHTTTSNALFRKRQYGTKRAPPQLETNSGHSSASRDATTSLKTLLMSKQHREQRRAQREVENSKTRYSRRRQIAERSARDLSEELTTSFATLNTSCMRLPRQRDLEGSSSRWHQSSSSFYHNNMEDSLRLPQRKGSTEELCQGHQSASSHRNNHNLEDSLRLPQRQASSEPFEYANCRASNFRTSNHTQDTALSTLCQSAVDLVDQDNVGHPFDGSSGELSQDTPPNATASTDRLHQEHYHDAKKATASKDRLHQEDYVG